MDAAPGVPAGSIDGTVMASPGAKIIPLSTGDQRPVRVLTSRMMAGEQEAFSVFHELYCDRLFRYLLVLCKGEEALARDLLQITMLKVVRAIRVFEGEEQFWNWLATVARHSFLDHIRKRRRGPEFDFISRDEATNVAAPQSPDADASLLSALEHGLAELPAEERALVESFYFQSATYRSLAAEQEISEKAIESRLARTRQKLRNAITRYLRYENC
jgi:RNA polymerase sigma-70 factor, ECF subfamily